MENVSTKKSFRCPKPAPLAGPLLLLLFLLWLLFPPSSALAGSESGWKTKNNLDYYYSQQGTPLTGVQRIGKYTYYFLEDGRQFHGWVELGGRYYCFSQKRKAKGHLITQGEPNGFPLGSGGGALLATTGETERMQAFAYVSDLMTRRTKSTWGKKKKLKAMYNYALLFPYLYDDTDKTAAQCVLKFARQMDGDCADTNSFLAFAGALLGQEAYVVNDFGHWWAQIDALIYDTNYGNFAATLEEAPLAGFSYNHAQQVAVNSSLAGTLMMTIHPERYGYEAPAPITEELFGEAPPPAESFTS